MQASISSDPALAPRFLSGPAAGLRLRWQAVAIIALYGASLLSVNLGGNRVLTYHEVVFCEPAREMLQTGDWIVPRIAGVPFLDKGPLTAWMIAGSMALFGQNETAVRLPGILSALLTACLIAALAARWFGNRAGLVAGLMQLSMYYLLQLSRLAECDTHLITTVCGAMCSFAFARVDHPQGRSTARWLPWTFYFCVGAAFLIKGPIGPFFILSGCLLFLVVNQDLRGLRFFFDPLGLAILALLVVPHPLLVYAKYPPALEMWMLHNLGRFRGTLGTRPPLYYLYQVPLILLPWLPFALWKVARGMRQGLFVEPIWRFLACWVVPGMVFLCASSFKSKHYPAPLMPAVTIAAALGMIDFLHARYRRASRHHLWMAAATVLGCGAGAGMVLKLQPRAAGGIAALVAMLGAGLLVMIYLERRRWLNAHLAAAFATAWLMVAGVFSWVMPHHDTYRDQTELARRINAAAPGAEPVVLVGLPENQITFYLDRPMVRRDRLEQFTHALPQDDRAQYHILAPEHVAAALRSVGEVRVLDRCASIIRWMKHDDRLTYFAFESSPAKVAALQDATRR